jgi:membrane protease YdiL (CAAX protease family)
MTLLIPLFPDSAEALQQAMKPFEEALGRASPAEWLGIAALLALLAPVCEELAFRGFLLRAFRPAIGTALAVILTGALFGFLHPPMPRPLVLGAVGIGFGFMAVRTGSVWTAVAAHVVNNGLTTLLEALGTSERGGESAAETLGGLTGGDPWIQAATVALALAVTVLGLLLLRPAGRPPTDNC